MDKLKPILAYKFWILFVLTIILPPVGWWMTAGALATTIDTRIAAVDKAKKQIPKADGQPNPQWEKQLADLNKAQKDRVSDARYRLWQTQQQLMKWPPVIAKYMGNVGFRQKPPELSVVLSVTTLYKDAYAEEVQRLRRILEPYNVEKNTGIMVVEPTAFRDEAVVIDGQRFRASREPPSIAAMWNAQEDIWLLEALLSSIRQLNVDAVDINEAVVKQLITLSLHGGNAGAAASAEGEEAAGAGDALPTFGQGFNSRKKLGGGAGGFGIKNSRFAPSDAFGAAWPPDEGEPKVGERGTSRYVGTSTGSPFVKRGFYLEVVMDHRRIPDLIVQLTNNPWPVQISRVQYSAINTGKEGTDVSTASKSGKSSLNKSGLSSGAGLNNSADQAALAPVMANQYLAQVSLAGTLTLYSPVAPPKNRPSPGAPNADPDAAESPIADATAAPPVDEAAAVEEAAAPQATEAIPTAEAASADAPAANPDAPPAEQSSTEPAPTEPAPTEPPAAEAPPTETPPAEPAPEGTPPAEETP